MKKIFSLFAAVLFAGSMMATDVLSVDFTKGQGSWTTNDVELGSLTYVWSQSSSYGMKASAYKSGAVATESWLVSPAIDLSGATEAELAINQAVNYGAPADFLSVKASADGENWTTLTLSAWPEGDSWTWVDATADLSDFAGEAEVQVAFVYTSTSSKAVTWEIKTVKVTSDGEEPVVEPITCAEVYALADAAEVALKDVVVTYINGKNVFVKDESGAMLLYLPSDSPWKAGDVLSGIEGVISVFNGLYEIKPSADQVDAVEATAGEAPAPEVLEVINADKDINKYVLLKNVEADGVFAEGTVSNITITLGENEYTLRNGFKNAFTFAAGKKYDVLATVSYYKNAVQLTFISAEEAQGTGISNTAVEVKAVKVIRNGQVVILRDGKAVNLLGVEL